MLVGAAAIAAAGLIYKMHKAGKLDRIENELSNMVDRTKRDVKNSIANGANEMEYVKDRAGYHATKLSSEIKNSTK